MRVRINLCEGKEERMEEFQSFKKKRLLKYCPRSGRSCLLILDLFMMLESLSGRYTEGRLMICLAH